MVTETIHLNFKQQTFFNYTSIYACSCWDNMEGQIKRYSNVKITTQKIRLKIEQLMRESSKISTTWNIFISISKQPCFLCQGMRLIKDNHTTISIHSFHTHKKILTKQGYKTNTPQCDTVTLKTKKYEEPRQNMGKSSALHPPEVNTGAFMENLILNPLHNF